MKKSSLTFFLLGCVLAAGCGTRESSGKLSGKITFDNNPVYEGILAVVTAEGRHPVNGRINGDGTYTVAKAPAGPVKIAFQPLHASEGDGSKTASEKMPGDIFSKMNKMNRKEGAEPPGGVKLTDDQKKSALALRKLPEHFRNWEKSGLTTTVEPNTDNTYDIEMKSK